MSLIIQLVQIGMLIPNRTQSSVGQRVPIEAAIHTHGIEAVVLIVVHEVVGREAEDAAVEMRTVLVIIDAG